MVPNLLYRQQGHITLVLYVTYKGLGSSKALLQSKVPQVQSEFDTWNQRLGVFCLGIENIYVDMSQTQTLSSHRDQAVAQDVFPLG